LPGSNPKSEPATLRQVLNQSRAQLKSERAKSIFKWLQQIFLVGFLIYLAIRLTRVGWTEILGTLPTSPWFYIISIALFCVPVICEWQSYRVITQKQLSKTLPIFARKRVFNEALFSFAGEAYLSARLSDLSGFDTRKSLIAIKDNNLVSALVSNSWAILLVGLLWLLGRSDILQNIWAVSPVLIGGFALLCVILYIASLFWFRLLTSLAVSRLIKVFTIHLLKITAVTGLQILQWKTALPSEVLLTWLIFVTVQILLKRIPGLPNADLIFLGVGLSLVGFADATTQQVAAMLVASAVMMQLVHFIAYILTLRFGGNDFKKAGQS